VGKPMSTIILIWLLATVLLTTAPVAEAQQPRNVAQIGRLTPGSASTDTANIKAFREGLRNLGYIERQNINIEYRYGEGIDERFPNLVAELLHLKTDVLLTVGTPVTQIAQNATKTVPIVMVNVIDPVATGLVASLARPGGNVTGLSNLFSELGGKQLELFKEAFPSVSRAAVLWEPANAGNALWLREMKLAAEALQITLQPLEVRSPNDFEPAFSAIKRDRAGALIVLRNALTGAYRTRIIELAAKSRLPAMYPQSDHVDSGGLMSYGTNLVDLHRRAATYVDKILKGAKPADLPVEQPTKFELVINLKTAKQIGLTIPPNVLARADRVIR
jgi:ABC-type uncharacterized transport system substrate-binding protein